MNKRSQEPSNSSDRPEKASAGAGRRPRRVAPRTGLPCLPEPGARSLRRLRWHQGALSPIKAMPRGSISPAQRILGPSDGSASSHDDEAMLQMLLEMVEEVMHDLPDDGRVPMPGLPVLEPCTQDLGDVTPRPERLRRVESILRSLAHMLLATL